MFCFLKHIGDSEAAVAQNLVLYYNSLFHPLKFQVESPFQIPLGSGAPPLQRHHWHLSENLTGSCCCEVIKLWRGLISCCEYRKLQVGLLLLTASQVKFQEVTHVTSLITKKTPDKYCEICVDFVVT